MAFHLDFSPSPEDVRRMHAYIFSRPGPYNNKRMRALASGAPAQSDFDKDFQTGNGLFENYVKLANEHAIHNL